MEFDRDAFETTVVVRTIIEMEKGAWYIKGFVYGTLFGVSVCAIIMGVFYYGR